MARILAVADEVDDSLYSADIKKLRVDLVAACGDLPFDYLESLVTLAGVPLVYIPGNHDPDLKRRAQDISPADALRPFSFRSKFDCPGPQGCTNIDGRVAEIAGLRIAGLGGSMRHNEGPNQYTQTEMHLRAAKLELKARVSALGAPKLNPRRGFDVLLTHSPPLGIGDDEDLCHEGFAAFHGLVARLSPRVLIHGHIHPYGRQVDEMSMNGTRVINAVGHRVVEL
ncbi:MAG: metallophosphoesterase family protein [Actinomycetota bacterium]